MQSKLFKVIFGVSPADYFCWFAHKINSSGAPQCDRTSQAKCLFDQSVFDLSLDHTAEGMLPGERFDADQQCKWFALFSFHFFIFLCAVTTSHAKSSFHTTGGSGSILLVWELSISIRLKSFIIWRYVSIASLTYLSESFRKLCNAT